MDQSILDQPDCGNETGNYSKHQWRSGNFHFGCLDFRDDKRAKLGSLSLSNQRCNSQWFYYDEWGDAFQCLRWL